MENTNDKNFVSHNSDKLFIRTMEDDLKKIKNIPAENDGAASVVSPLSSNLSRISVFREKINRPVPISDPALQPETSDRRGASAPEGNFFQKETSAIVPPVPKNLPVDMPFSEKEEPKAETKTEKPKLEEAVKKDVNSNAPDSQAWNRFNLFGKKPADDKKTAPNTGPAASFDSISELKREAERKIPSRLSPQLDRSARVFKPVATDEKEKIPSVSKPIAPVSANAFAGKRPNRGYMIDENENLSPEARLARQSSLGDINSEYKESLIMPPPSRVYPSQAQAGQSGRLAEVVNSARPKTPSLEEKRKAIEEIIEEDNKNSFLGKFFKMFFALLIIIGIGAGAYYFLIVKKPPVNPGFVSTPSQSFAAGAAEATINVDLNDNLNSTIKSYFSGAKPPGIYRLILKDKNGQNSLGLEGLKKSLNIVFPDAIGNALEKDYNLMAFNYPEKGYLRLGFILKPKASSGISNLARNWEPNMYKNIEPIFMGNLGFYDPKKQFGSNRQGNFDIRYLSLGFENIALNYAIDNKNNFFIIATSKQDIFNLIDKIIQGK